MHHPSSSTASSSPSHTHASFSRFLLLTALVLYILQLSLLAHGQTDPCMGTCCSRGWNYYGEGNFSKLGVNGSSDCNCFDTQINKCGSGEDEEFVRARRMRAENSGMKFTEQGEESGGMDSWAESLLNSMDDNHCMTACCPVGHALYGYGDYARILNCNCAMQLPTPC